jgi:hypothetical protein
VNIMMRPTTEGASDDIIMVIEAAARLEEQIGHSRSQTLANAAWRLGLLRNRGPELHHRVAEWLKTTSMAFSPGQSP